MQKQTQYTNRQYLTNNDFVKTALKPTHYTDVDFRTTESLFDMLKGIALLSLGSGLTYGSLKGLRKRVFEATAPEVVQPSALVRKRMKDSRIPVDPNYLPPIDGNEQSQENADLEKESSYLVHKFCKYAADPAPDPKANQDVLERLLRGIGRWFYNVGSGISHGFQRQEPPVLSKAERNWYENIEGIRPLKSEDIHDLNSRGVHLHSLDEARERGGLYRLKGELAARPGLRSMWFLPAATAIGYTGFSLGRTTADLVENALGKSKPQMTYEDDAKKIYEQSARYLKDVAEGKDVEDPEEKKKKKQSELTKESEAKPKFVSGDGSTTFWGWSSLLGIPLALLVARQFGNFREGVLNVKNELADRTHMIRAWQAAAKERRYDYNDLASEIVPEPISDDTAKKILKAEKDLQDRIKDDDNNNQLRYENYLFKGIRDDQDSMV